MRTVRLKQAKRWKVWKPSRAIRFSDKYDLRFQDRSFHVELLLQEVDLLFDIELSLEVELLFSL